MRSLRLRVLFTIAAVSIVTLAGIGLFSARTTTLDLERIAGQAPHVDAARFAPVIEAAYARRGSWGGIASTLKDLDARAGVRFVVLSPRNAMVASFDPEVSAMKASVDRNGRLSLAGTATDGSAAAIVLDEPRTVLHDRRGAVIGSLYALPEPPLAAPPPDLQAVEINRRLWIAIVIAAVAATIAAFVLSTHILRPIEALTDAARRLAAGDLRVRMANPGADEIGTLGRSFNAMADELARLEQLRKDMVADVAHELRTPLTHMRGRIEALQDGRLQPDASTFAALHADTLQLARLVGDLQDLSLADAGRLHLSRESVDVDSVVRAAVNALPPQRVDARLDAGLPLALADPARLRQILDNLLANAIAHAHPGGLVFVSGKLAGRSIEIAVHNDGMKISEPELSQIFERFYRTDKSRSRLTGGAGLGLTIVKQLVEASGGSVWAENTTDPEGVSLNFTLPIAE